MRIKVFEYVSELLNRAKESDSKQAIVGYYNMAFGAICFACRMEDGILDDDFADTWEDIRSEFLDLLNP